MKRIFILVNMKNILIILCLFVFIGCGSKKKITKTNKSYDLVVSKQNKTVQEQLKVNSIGTTKTKTKVTQSLNQTIIERYIFSDEGRLTEYSKETNKQEDKETNVDENKGLSSDSIGTKTETLITDSTNESEKETKDIDLNKKSSNPIYYWIGAAIFIVIIAFGAKYLLKL